MNKIVIVFCLFFSTVVSGQKKDTAHLYDPSADAEKDIAAIVKKAKSEHKFILLEAGGNWCGWCKRFSILVANDSRLDSIINANFIVYQLNFSKENRNEKLFSRYGYPQRFGFPVFIILDEKGNRIHTQDSGYLEEGRGYNKEKIAEFLQLWSPKALDPDAYLKE